MNRDLCYNCEARASKRNTRIKSASISQPRFGNFLSVIQHKTADQVLEWFCDISRAKTAAMLKFSFEKLN